MRKRLFRSEIEIPLIILVFIGFLWISSFIMRSLSLTWSFSNVSAKIPIASITANHPNSSNERMDKLNVIDKNTITIILSDNEFFFGRYKDFTDNFDEIRNKFSIPHVHGSPNVYELLEKIYIWKSRSDKNIDNMKYPVLLLASNHWPMAIIIQIIHELKKSRIIKDVIMAGGLN